MSLIALKLLNTPQTAEILGLRPNTLEIWRVQGKGPIYRKVGKLVRYSESDVLAWLDTQSRTSTSQQQALA
jgi:predicted DNA-binding transcriptional regulator AlpA